MQMSCFRRSDHEQGPEMRVGTGLVCHETKEANMVGSVRSQGGEEQRPEGTGMRDF